MINFKTFLTEARMAPLYHGTPVSKIDSIFSTGLKPVTLQERRKLLKPEATSPNITLKDKGRMKLPHHIEGVSTTRSFAFAKNWGSVVIELNQQALAQRYEIKPIQYFQAYPGEFSPARSLDATGYHNEYEEFVITDKPIPVKYFTRIYIPARWQSRNILTDDRILPIQQKFGSSFIRTY